MGGSYYFWGSDLEKFRINLEKRPFFRADLAGLGKYHTRGFGRIGVYRVNAFLCDIVSDVALSHIVA